jgi:hypothetical protein
MKLETTMRSLKIHYYSNLYLSDVTHFVWIGRPFSRQLRGPVPLNLLPPGVAVIGVNGRPPAPPGLNFHLLKFTRMSVDSGNLINWRT